MMRLRTLAVLAVAALIACTALSRSGIGVSDATFARSTSNPSNEFTAAASFCTNPSTETLKAVSDAYVDEAAPDKNYGTEEILFVQSLARGENRRTLVAFDLPKIPDLCSVTDATLRLYATASTPDRTIQVFQALGRWDETTVTWNTQPGVTGPEATAKSAVKWNAWGVTSQVDAMYSSGINDGFLIRDETEDDRDLAEQQYQARDSRDDTLHPELEITFG